MLLPHNTIRAALSSSLPPSLPTSPPSHQIKKGGLLKSLIFKWAFGRKKYYMEQGWRYDQVRLYRWRGATHPHCHMEQGWRYDQEAAASWLHISCLSPLILILFPPRPPPLLLGLCGVGPPRV